MKVSFEIKMDCITKCGRRPTKCGHWLAVSI